MEVQVGHHSPNDGELLRIFLPEDRDIRLDQIEQLEHHRQHALEEPWPEGSLEHLAHRARAYRDHLLGRVHLLMSRGEDHVDALFRTDGEVVGQRSRIAVEVLARPELERVDEDRDHERIR